MSRPARATFAGVIGGFVIWALAFVAIYGVQATGCMRGWDGTGPGGAGFSPLRLALIALLVAAFAGLAVLRPVTRGASLVRGSFLGTLARVCHAAAVVATVICFAAVLFLPLC